MYKVLSPHSILPTSVETLVTLVTGKSPTWIILQGSHCDISGFQTIATCQDGLKNSRDKSTTSPFDFPASTRNGEIGDVANKSTSRVCRGRHGEVGIMEFGLCCFRPTVSGGGSGLGARGGVTVKQLNVSWAGSNLTCQSESAAEKPKFLSLRGLCHQRIVPSVPRGGDAVGLRCVTFSLKSTSGGFRVRAVLATTLFFVLLPGGIIDSVAYQLSRTVLID